MQNHGVCLIEQAIPRATGPIHPARPAPFPVANRSHRHTAKMRKGMNRASVPPSEKRAISREVRAMTNANQRRVTGTMTKRRTPAMSHAPRSIQSTMAWWKPSAIAGTSRRNEPAG